MKMPASRIAAPPAWMLAAALALGAFGNSTAFAHDGERHDEENPHVLYGKDALVKIDRGEVIATDTHLNE